MFHIAICDDSRQEMEVVLALLNKYQAERPGNKLQIHAFFTGAELLENINNGQKFDLFLLDILMPDLSGIELARKLRAHDENVPLIFLTSTSEYALDAFNVQASHYILKPTKADNLFRVLDKIVFTQNKLQDNFFLISTANSKLKIPFSSIVCVESMYHKMLFCLADGSKLFSKSIRIPFPEAIAPLIADKRFLYAHKSYVLNMEQVKELTGNSFVMKDNTVVPVPRYKFANAKSIYLDYIFRREGGF